MNYCLTFTSVILHQLLINSTTVSSEHTTWSRDIGSEAAIWLRAPPATPVYQGTLIKPASKPPVPSATWVSHHLERARDEPSLSRPLTAIRANEGTISLLKDLRVFSRPWAAFDKVGCERGVIWFLGSAQSVIYVSLCHIFRRTARATKL